MWKKIIYSIFAVCFLATIAFSGIQTFRLERSMAECRQYRAELELAQNRESEIRANVSRTGEILCQTTNSVAELREKLKTVEDSYNYLWNLLYNDDDTIYNGEKEISERNAEAKNKIQVE